MRLVGLSVGGRCLRSARQEAQVSPGESPVGAVHIPGEIVLDSWLFSVALATHARENGAVIFTNFEYDPTSSSWDEESEIWTIGRNNENDSMLEAMPPNFLRTKAVVNATGIMADLVQQETEGVNAPQWSAKPRRGQYRVFFSGNVTSIPGDQAERFVDLVSSQGASRLSDESVYSFARASGVGND